MMLTFQKQISFPPSICLQGYLTHKKQLPHRTLQKN